jgi:hypothetical protein
LLFTAATPLPLRYRDGGGGGLVRILLTSLPLAGTKGREGVGVTTVPVQTRGASA